MGTYIEAFVERDSSKEHPPFSNPEQIQSLTEGSFDLPREYDVFDALGFGRSAGYSRRDRLHSLVPRYRHRGFPSPVSLAAALSYLDLIVPRGKKPDKFFWGGGQVLSEAEAARRKSERRCRVHTVIQWFNTGGANRIVWKALPKPYVYNASWLSPVEYGRALAHHRLSFRRIPKEYLILKSALSILERAYGGNRVRLLFRFS